MALQKKLFKPRKLAKEISIAKAYAAHCIGYCPTKLRGNGSGLSFVDKENDKIEISIEDKLDSEDFKDFKLGYFNETTEATTKAYNNGKKMRKLILDLGHLVYQPNH